MVGPVAGLAVLTGTGPIPAPVPAAALANTPAFSSAVYQFAPHTTIPDMQSVLPAIAEMGFTGVQMPPIHPPGRVKVESKIGSAYAPRSVMEVSPHLSAGISPPGYLTGSYVPPTPDEGWGVLKDFVAKARELGLRVVADLVLAHTAGDPDVVDAYVERFGRDFYLDIPTGAYLESGIWDGWTDICPINYSGPVRDRILREYCAPVVERFIESGVSAFRADAASRIPNDFWAALIDSARLFTERRGFPRPAFYAETVGTSLSEEVAFVRDGHFDAVTTSLRWWSGNPTQKWLLERMEAVRGAGGINVSFMDTPDTDRAVTTFGGISGVMRQLALTAFMSSSMLVLAGTLGLDHQQPSVFLDRNQPTAVDFGQGEATGGNALISGAMRMLLGLKGRYPVLHSRAYMELVLDGGPVIRVRRTTPTEQVEIAFNTGGGKATYYVPPEFRGGNIFGTNTWRPGHTWYGVAPNPHVIEQYDLAPGGLVVFYRGVDETEGLKVPGF